MWREGDGGVFLQIENGYHQILGIAISVRVLNVLARELLDTHLYSVICVP